MGANHPDYGDLDRMGELGAHLRELGTIPSRASGPIAEALTELLADEYADGKDPYGVPWAPLAPRTLQRHGPPPLTYRGDMAAATLAKPLPGAGIALEAPFPAGIHMTGGSSGAWHMPARPMFPVYGKLPDLWSEAIDRVLGAVFGGKR